MPASGQPLALEHESRSWAEASQLKIIDWGLVTKQLHKMSGTSWKLACILDFYMAFTFQPQPRCAAILGQWLVKSAGVVHIHLPVGLEVSPGTSSLYRDHLKSDVVRSKDSHHDTC